MQPINTRQRPESQLPDHPRELVVVSRPEVSPFIQSVFYYKRSIVNHDRGKVHTPEIKTEESQEKVSHVKR